MAGRADADPGAPGDYAQLQLTQTADGVRIPVRAIPRAGRDGLGGVRDGRLVVKVRAAPEDGKANAAVLKVLADALGVPLRSLSLAAGAASRSKVVEVVQLTDAQVRARLASL